VPYLQVTARSSAPTRDDLVKGLAVLPLLACLMGFRGSDMAGLATAALAAFFWLGSGPLDTGSIRPRDRRSWRGSAQPLSGFLWFFWPGRARLGTSTSSSATRTIWSTSTWSPQPGRGGRPSSGQSLESWLWEAACPLPTLTL